MSIKSGNFASRLSYVYIRDAHQPPKVAFPGLIGRHGHVTPVEGMPGASEIQLIAVGGGGSRLAGADCRRCHVVGDLVVGRRWGRRWEATGGPTKG
jgi:hypothetical protein